MFTRVTHLPCLGVLINSSGDTSCALEHRITAAQRHFYARAPKLTCRRVSLKRRIQRLYSTVHK
eukprot:8412283-Heterocapsa_arctica.AAC.1